MPLDQLQPNINYLPDADDQPLLMCASSASISQNGFPADLDTVLVPCDVPEWLKPSSEVK